MEFAIKIPEDMRKRYTERRARDAEEIAVAIESGRLEVLGRIGHQLKGNAATYGYENLADLGKKMERALEEHSVPTARECLYELKAWLAEQKPAAAGEDG